MSTSETLTGLIRKILPQSRETGIINHLLPNVRVEEKSRGKAIVFTWKRSTFRLSANHVVKEQNFMNEWTDTDESRSIQDKVRVAISAS